MHAFNSLLAVICRSEKVRFVLKVSGIERTWKVSL